MGTPAAHPRIAAIPRRARARGVTLAELAVSLLVVAILSVTIGSVLVLTSKAVGLSAAHAGEVWLDDAVATIAAEQRFALAVTERTSRSIAFTVADRDKDGLPESIRYAWSGIAGDPLTRQLNLAAPVVLIPRVRRFHLSYLTRATPGEVYVPEAESPEVLLFAHEGGSATSSVSTLAWVAQFFKPNWTALAPGRTVTGWKVTGVQVVASKWPATTNATQWNLGLYEANQATRQPVSSLAIIENRKFLPALNSATPNWIASRVGFSTNAGLDPAKGVCLVVGPPALAPSGYVGVDATGGEPGGYFMTSGNGGTSYGNAVSGRSLRVRVYGTYTYQGP